MKVNNSIASGLQSTEAAKNNKIGEKGVSNDKADLKTGSGLSADRVDVSTDAMRMQKAKDIASDDSIDEAKVAKFQALIDQGEYQVDAQAVADRLVDEYLMASE